MKVKIDKSFEGDTNKIYDPKLLRKIAACIGHVISSSSVTQIPNLKKLQGFNITTA